MAEVRVRFGDYLRVVALSQHRVSYNLLAPKPEFDADGNVVPYRPAPLELRGIDVHRILAPYVSVRFMAQVKSVVPLALYLIAFQIFILRQGFTDRWEITLGLLAVIVGLMIFMEGLKLGLMPFGEIIGHGLPKKSPLPVVLFTTFLLGIGVTLAEPAIGALQAVGSIVDVNRAPYLWALLNQWTGTLVLCVGMGVGAAAVLGTLRFLNGWSLKPLIYLALIPALSLTVYSMFDDGARTTLGLAWDSGAVTTGPITVPLVLALGIGIAAAGGKGNSSLSGFGIVTLASIFPIIAVMILSLYLTSTVSPDDIINAAATAVANAPAVSAWYEKTPVAEIILAVRAIVPLTIFLFLVLKFIVRERVQEPGIVLYGLTLTLLGMMVFNVGLSYGLAKLGGQSGSLVPAAFMSVEEVQTSPLYVYGLGVAIALIFAWLLGFGATLAEPALNALGLTVENLTNGAFKKSTLMYAVSTGVAFGIALGIFKIIYDIPLAYFLVPGYAFAAALTAVSSEEYVNIAWDSAGVTTGPVTVPLVLAMGLGFGNAMNAVDGFGILSMASIGPILSVLITGLAVRARIRRIERASEKPKSAVAVPAV